MDTTIIIGIVSATSALAGVALAQLSAIVQDHLKRKHEKRKLLREKYEELANYVTESHLWSTELLQATSLPQVSSSTPIQARKAATLANIYFPLLREPAWEYLNSCALLHVVIIENFKFVPGVTAGAQAAHHDRQAFDQAGDRMHRARQQLDDAITQYANKYTRA
jgi:hypothetical protein